MNRHTWSVTGNGMMFSNKVATLMAAEIRESIIPPATAWCYKAPWRSMATCPPLRPMEFDGCPRPNCHIQCPASQRRGDHHQDHGYTLPLFLFLSPSLSRSPTHTDFNNIYRRWTPALTRLLTPPLPQGFTIHGELLTTWLLASSRLHSWLHVSLHYHHNHLASLLIKVYKYNFTF